MSSLLKCLAVDDEPHALELLGLYIEKTPFLELAKAATSPLEAMEWLQQHEVGLLFLDIQMDELTGLQLLEVAEPKCPVILTTAYSEYALESYEHQVSDYLLKPFSFERFLKAANRARARHRAVSPPPPDNPPQPGYIFIKGDAKHKYHRLHLGSIHYIEGLRNYVRFIGEDGRIVSLQNLGALEEELPGQQFARIHKSYIVNLRHVQEVDGNSLLVAGRRLPIGGSYRAAFHRLIEACRLGL